MHYDPKVFKVQFLIAKKFVYHVFYYKGLLAAYQKHGLQDEFWTHTIDAHLLQAAILWCMIFGSEGCNPTHWKYLSKEQTDDLKRSFRDGLLQSTGMSQQQWDLYWQDMTAFRSKFVAHRELVFDKPVPHFDVALKVVYYYDQWIRNVIAPDVFDEPTLEETSATLKEEIGPLIEQLYETTMKHYRNVD